MIHENGRLTQIFYTRKSSYSDYRKHDYIELMDGPDSFEYGQCVDATFRKQYLMTRSLLRGALSRLVPHSPQQWRFHRDRRGRLRLDDRVTTTLNSIDFSISHSTTLIAVAIGYGCRLGVDVEDIGIIDEPTIRALCAEHFGKSEISYLNKAKGPEIVERFYEVWTRAEARYKTGYWRDDGAGMNWTTAAPDNAVSDTHIRTQRCGTNNLHEIALRLRRHNSMLAACVASSLPITGLILTETDPLCRIDVVTHRLAF